MHMWGWSERVRDGEKGGKNCSLWDMNQRL